MKYERVLEGMDAESEGNEGIKRDQISIVGGCLGLLMLK